MVNIENLGLFEPSMLDEQEELISPSMEDDNLGALEDLEWDALL